MIVGTAGHIDHGKTALIRLLTGVDTDRLKEEKARGISIDLGFAYWPRPSGAIVGFVDVPGHEALVHNMLAGATGIDYVILVIAANDGIKPQTREHLAIIDLLGLERGIVALNKCDLADGERIASVSGEIEALLKDSILKGAEIVPVSAVTGEGLARLATCIDAAAEAPAVRPSGGRFRLAVDRSFTLAGQGSAVTGTVLSGAVCVGDRIIVSPAGLEARVRSIHAQNRPVERGEAGQRCALVLSGARIAKDALHRGDMVLDPALHAPAARIDARLRVLPSEPKPLGHWFPVKVHHAASEVPGRIVVLSGEQVQPGETGFVQLVLERPLAAAAGDRFILRDTSSRRTVGGGSFIDLRAPERRRRTPQRLAQLEALTEKDPEAALARLLNGEDGWIGLDGFFRDRAVDGEAAASITAKLGLVTFPGGAGVVAMLPRRWDAFRSEVTCRLGAFHAGNPDLPGIGLEQLRRAVIQNPVEDFRESPLSPRGEGAGWGLSSAEEDHSSVPSPLGERDRVRGSSARITRLLPAPLFAAALKKLAAGGDVSLDRMWVRLPGHTVKFSAEDERLLALVLRKLNAEPYRPPRVRDIAKAIAIDEDIVRRLLRMSARRGDAEEMAHDHFFARPAVEAMARTAIELAERSAKGLFTAADFRDRLNNGRKVAIQILEFFDRHGFTIRRQDLRRINPARIDMFVPRPAAAEPDMRPEGGVPFPVGRPDFKSGPRAF